MPLRRTLALFGAATNVCLLSGCIFTDWAVRDRSPAERDREWEMLSDKPPPDEPKAVAVTPPPAPAVVERPEAPPEPKLVPPQPAESPGPARTALSVPPAPSAPPAPPPSAALPDPPAIAVLRAYLDQKPDSEGARKVFQRLHETDRVVLDALLPIVKDACADGLDVEQVVKALDLLEERLRPRRPLTLDKVCFARGFEGFGVYEPLAEAGEVPVFHSGLDGRPGERVQVYVEVRNFASRRVGACWETALASTLEIEDEWKRRIDFRGVRGETLEQLRRPARVDCSLSPRQDYCLNIQFHIPPRMPPGSYKLRVTVGDEIAPADGVRRTDFRTLMFRVEPPR